MTVALEENFDDTLIAWGDLYQAVEYHRASSVSIINSQSSYLAGNASIDINDLLQASTSRISDSDSLSYLVTPNAVFHANAHAHAHASRALGVYNASNTDFSHD